MSHDILLIQKGDSVEFKRLFDEFYPSLCFFANKIIQQKDIANDIAQDAFIQYWEIKSDFHSIQAAKSYMFKYVKNRCLNFLRDNHFDYSVNLREIEKIASTVDFTMENETYQMIYDAIKSLTPTGKRVIELSMDGFKNNEIAKYLSITVNTVKTIKLRAYKALRAKLKGNFFNYFF